jgi:hypothetical protein
MPARNALAYAAMIRMFYFCSMLVNKKSPKAKSQGLFALAGVHPRSLSSKTGAAAYNIILAAAKKPCNCANLFLCGRNLSHESLRVLHRRYIVSACISTIK